MKRRTVLKQLAFASAAAWILPSCISDPKKISIALKNLQITGDEEELLGNLADVIIPPGETPGARAVEAHLFTLIMVDECLDKAEQEKYLKGMRMFDESVKPLTGKTFTKASPEERLTILTSLEASLDKFPEEVKAFYSRSRGYILQGYLTSQHFLTNVKPFKHIPGPQFKGCAPVNQNQNPV